MRRGGEPNLDVAESKHYPLENVNPSLETANATHERVCNPEAFATRLIETENALSNIAECETLRACCADPQPATDIPDEVETISNTLPWPILSRVWVDNVVWSNYLVLGGNGRLEHSAHGSLASYFGIGDILVVNWDKFEQEVFIKCLSGYCKAGPIVKPTVDPREGIVVNFGESQLKVTRFTVCIPETNVQVSLRPGSSDSEVFKAIFLAHEYENINFQPRVIVDLGANIGLSSLYFAIRFPNAKIYAVEPEPTNFLMVLENISKFPQITAIQAAVWHTDTTLALQTSDGFGNSLGDWGVQTVERSDTTSASVRAISVPTILKRYNIETIDILKVDIEGAELELFSKGTEQWLSSVNCVVVETHDRFRSGSDVAVSQALAANFIEQQNCGECRVFVQAHK